MRSGLSLLVVLSACAPKSAPVPAAEQAPAEQAAPTPPDAPARDHVHTEHDVQRDDPYYWMRDREDPELLPYLEAENTYAEAMTAHLDGLRTTLYDEMLGRIQEDDLSVPVRMDDWWYYTRTEEGKAYPIHCRKLGEDGEEQVLLDENVLAEGLEFMDLGSFEVSADHELLAYATDTTGREIYTIRVLDLGTGEALPDVIEDSTANIEWSTDNQTLLYSRMDEALRPYQILAHTLGAEGEDTVLYTEEDEQFGAWVYRLRSKEYLAIETSSTLSSEVRVAPADQPLGDWTVLSARHPGHEYSIEHHEDRWLFVTNDCDDDDGNHIDCALNFKLMDAPLDATDRSQWTEVVPHRDDVTLLGVDAFADHWVLTERADGLRRLVVRDAKAGTDSVVPMPESAYWAGLSWNPSFDTDTVRFTYTSPVTPRSVFDLELASQERTLLKETPVIGYDRSLYEVERWWATSPDGTKVPATAVMRTDLGEGPHPVVLTGYGSYGASYDPFFSSTRLSLLDHGAIHVIAHIRGGGEMGRSWYEDGKFLKKKNSFDDFIAVADHLVAEGITTPDQLAIEGGSAGGLLMGAVVNARPELFHVVVAQVPFVDVVTTMLDESIPLTAGEWEEWGDPREREFFDYMLSYSPYDNVSEQAYPAMLIESGLNDRRVQYFEPTKWAARLRDRNTGDAPLLLKTNMGAGHGGSSGRYGYLEEAAWTWAFVLDQLGLASTEAPQVAVP